MPQQLSSQDVLRELRRIRYSSRKGRRLDLSWIARQAGYRRESLYRAMNRGWIGTLMAARVGQVLQNVTDDRSQVTHSSLGEYGGGPDPRGGARFARRPDDRRLQAIRSQSARARGGTSGPYASLGSHGGDGKDDDGH
jgi:hypothetical protein